MGIVTYLTEVELGPGEPDVFVTAARGPDMDVLGYATGASLVGSGAGLTWDVARGAAIGECLERYAACIVDADGLLIGSYDDLVKSGRTAHDPSTWALFDPSQNMPYPSFTADQIIAWVQGWDLVTHGPLHFPACFAYLSSSPELSASPAQAVGPSVSTGCACAVGTDEAVLKGLCELIERDAFMIVWRNSLSIPEVVIDAGSDLYETYISRFARPGLEFRIWQTTMDLAVPSFFGMLFDHRGPITRVVVGGAAHPDASRAVLKTLCELNQGLLWLQYMGLQKDEAPADFDEIRTFTDRAMLYATGSMRDAYAFLLHDLTPVPLSSIASTQAPIDELLERCVQLVVRQGLRPAAVDLTTDDVGECGYVVARVMVPGLETMDGDHRLQMLGGRRWRDVPVSLGLRAEPCSIDDINPFPHPYP